MGNRKARQFKQQQDDAAAWNRVIAEPRLAIQDVHAPGIGARRLQLIVCPSFEKGQAWEARQREDEWSLFRSELVADWPDVQLLGYDRLSIASAALASLFARVTSLTLPLTPHLNDMGGADGTLMQLAVFGDLHSEWRCQWWSEPPPAWRPLVEITEEMMAAFAAAQD